MTEQHTSELGDDQRGAGIEVTVQSTTSAGIEAMLGLSPDAVVVVAEDGTIRRANELAAQMFRTDRSMLEGGPVDDLVPDEARERHARERDGYRARPSVRSMGSGRELRAVRADGAQFPVEISLQPVDLEGERLVLAVVRDVSSRRALQDANRELAADARTLREFVSVASHELRTPLTSVKGFAETLLSGRAADEDQERLLRRIVRNADRQEALVTGLLDLSRIQRGRLEVGAQQVPVVEVVTEVLEALDLPDIQADIPTSLVVRADRLRFEQVLLNVTLNAVRYGGPPVTIEATQTDAEVVVTVRDRGDGVAAEFESDMFEAFHQQSVGDRREASGLGLGLFLSRELMRAMAGAIRYRRDRGETCFDLRLPRADAVRAVTSIDRTA